MSRQRSGRTGENQTVTINYNGFELEISGYYNEGDSGDEWTAPTGSDLEVDKIIYNGVDLSELLTEILPASTYNDIIRIAIEQIESDL